MNEMVFEYIPTESEEQQAVFQWAAMVDGFVPDLKLLHHVPNGGMRNKVVASKLQKEGVKAGVPDIVLPVPINDKHGLYIEMKKRDHSNKPTQSQLWWINKLKAKGYVAKVCYGADEAIRTICDYLGIELEGSGVCGRLR